MYVCMHLFPCLHIYIFIAGRPCMQLLPYETQLRWWWHRQTGWVKTRNNVTGPHSNQKRSTWKLLRTVLSLQQEKNLWRCSPSSLALNGGGRIFSLPVLALIFPACSPVSSSHLLRDSLCTALQTEKLWIWSTGLSTQLTPSSRREAWVRGNLTALTERSQLATRWTRGIGGASCVWRLFPWRTLKISIYSEPW